MYTTAEIDLISVDPTGVFLWNYRVGEDITGTPAILYSPIIGGDGLLYLVTQDGYLYAVGQ